MLSSHFPIFYLSAELEAEYMIDIVGIVYLYDINAKFFCVIPMEPASQKSLSKTWRKCLLKPMFCCLNILVSDIKMFMFT